MSAIICLCQMSSRNLKSFLYKIVILYSLDVPFSHELSFYFYPEVKTYIDVIHIFFNITIFYLNHIYNLFLICFTWIFVFKSETLSCNKYIYIYIQSGHFIVFYVINLKLAHFWLILFKTAQTSFSTGMKSSKSTGINYILFINKYNVHIVYIVNWNIFSLEVVLIDSWKVIFYGWWMFVV